MVENETNIDLNLLKTPTETELQTHKNVLIHNSSSKMSKTKKCLIIFMITIVVIVFLLILSDSNRLLKLFKNNNNNLLIDATGLRNRSVCESRSCYKTSSFILGNMDESFDSCDNFYEFACGNIGKKKDLYIDQFKTADQNIWSDISVMLEKEIDNNKTQIISENSLTNFKLYYNSCLNQLETESFADIKMNDFFVGKFGEWPMLKVLENPPKIGKLRNNSLSKEPFKLEKFLAQLTSLRMPLLFRFLADDYTESHTILMRILVPEG
jgi:hypothetical protein